MHSLTLLAATLLATCGGSGDSTAPAQPSPPPSTGSAWDPVPAAVDVAFARNVVPRLAVTVYAPTGQVLYSRVRGDFALDRNIVVVSASKMVSGVVLLRLVDQGFLPLDSTTGAVLGWTGPQAVITLRHLLSLRSGLPVSFRVGDNCTMDSTITLAQCVADLATRPLVAGGLRLTTQEYACCLGVVYNRGTYQGQRLLASALVDQMGVDPFPAASTGSSPYERFGLSREYGLTAWLECTTPASSCQDITSPGAFGFTPWIDRDGR
jgi:CubicO group peptidase (beta-lactamase class C family)